MKRVERRSQPSKGGKLYLAAIPDVSSGFVVGWVVSAVNDRHLALNALGTAL